MDNESEPPCQPSAADSPRGAKVNLAVDWPGFNSYHSFAAMMLVISLIGLTTNLGANPDVRND